MVSRMVKSRVLWIENAMVKMKVGEYTEVCMDQHTQAECMDQHTQAECMDQHTQAECMDQYIQEDYRDQYTEVSSQSHKHNYNYMPHYIQWNVYQRDKCCCS